MHKKSNAYLTFRCFAQKIICTLCAAHNDSHCSGTAQNLQLRERHKMPQSINELRPVYQTAYICLINGTLLKKAPNFWFSL